jgi:hypothetical protein
LTEGAGLRDQRTPIDEQTEIKTKKKLQLKPNGKDLIFFKSISAPRSLILPEIASKTCLKASIYLILTIFTLMRCFQVTFLQIAMKSICVIFSSIKQKSDLETF